MINRYQLAQTIVVRREEEIMLSPERVELYCQEGTSDKVYIAELTPSGTKWTVPFQYGRRGNTLTIGCKTASPVEYEEAKHVFDKLVKEKVSKGYKLANASSPASASTIVTTQNEDTGFRAQLLNEIDLDQVQRLINDNNYCAQEKWDGRRMGLIKKMDVAAVCNKKGQNKAYTARLGACIEAIPVANFVIDGEGIGDKVHTFDWILQIGDRSTMSMPYKERYVKMLSLIKASKQKDLVPVDTAFTAAEKQQLFARLEKEGREGIVFKLLSAPYLPGKPASGGTQFKYKFRSDISCIVRKVNAGKRSVAIYVLDGEQELSVGNVTIPPNAEIPAPEDIIDVKYLYAYRQPGNGGTLYQPIFKGKRDDVARKECTVDRLKFKAEIDEEDN